MFQRSLRLAVFAGKYAFAAAIALSVTAAHAQTELVVGLNTANQLFRFESTLPIVFTSLTGTANTLTNVTGMVAGDSLRSIDYRPSNGLLYGLATQVTGTTSILRLYTIANTGVATLVTTLTAGAGTNGTTPTAAQAFSTSDIWHIDFNPQADALRIVDGGNPQTVGLGTGNYRITAANLATALGIAASDAPINGRDANDRFVQGIAYSNNVAAATSTSLYDSVYSADTNDTLYLQSPANSGTLVLPAGTARGNNDTILTSTAEGDMDISGVTGSAYYGGTAGLFNINLSTGAATRVGLFSGNVGTVRGIAAPVNAVVVPEAGTFALALSALAMVGTVLVRRKKA